MTERMIRVGALAGVSETARALGVPTTNVHRWAERREATGFPEPVYYSNPRFFLYDLDEVAEWHRLWVSTRRPGTRDGLAKRRVMNPDGSFSHMA